jgi:hypothetical protein
LFEFNFKNKFLVVFRVILYEIVYCSNLYCGLSLTLKINFKLSLKLLCMK